MYDYLVAVYEFYLIANTKLLNHYIFVLLIITIYKLNILYYNTI